jgi:hypothetical protein
MKSLVATCAIGWFAASIAPAYAEDQPALRLVQTIPVPGVMGRLAEMAMEEDGKLLICDSRADLIFQFDTRKRQLLKSWPAHGDGAGDLSLDRSHHRLFVGTRNPPEMTVYDSVSGREIASLPGPEAMDGVYYDPQLKRIYMSGGRWYGTPQASPGWVYVYQQKDADHYEILAKVQPGQAPALHCSCRN